MALNINFTPRARKRLKSIEAHISKSNDSAAGRVISRILQAVMMFERFPLLGREGKIQGTREFSIPNLPYIIVYKIISETDIDILTIIHERKKYP